jgi:hypothetical protein
LSLIRGWNDECHIGVEGFELREAGGGRMKISHRCPYCHNRILVDEKDVKKLSDRELRQIRRRDKELDSLKDEYEYAPFSLFFRRKVRKKFIESSRTDYFGKVKCCVCKKESYLISLEE